MFFIKCSDKFCKEFYYRGDPDYENELSSYTKNLEEAYRFKEVDYVLKDIAENISKLNVHVEIIQRTTTVTQITTDTKTKTKVKFGKETLIETIPATVGIVSKDYMIPGRAYYAHSKITGQWLKYFTVLIDFHMSGLNQTIWVEGGGWPSNILDEVIPFVEKGFSPRVWEEKTEYKGIFDKGLFEVEDLETYLYKRLKGASYLQWYDAINYKKDESYWLNVNKILSKKKGGIK